MRSMHSGSNILKYGGEYDTIHYTTFLAEHLDKLNFTKNLNYKVTFHDPCYLGRHHGEYESPRNLLRAIPGIDLVEIGHRKQNSFCCGGGGGGMWLDGFMADHVSERLSERRVREAVETGADVLAVCCPYEVSRFEDAVKSTGNEGKLVVRDIIELMFESFVGLWDFGTLGCAFGFEVMSMHAKITPLTLQSPKAPMP